MKTHRGPQALIMLLAFLASQVVSGQQSGSELLDRNYGATRHLDATADLTMTLTNKAGQARVRSLRLFSKLKPDGRDVMTVLLFRSPADIKGTATLLIEQSGKEDDMWIYLPSLRKTRRLLSDNKRDAFVGSDLSYGDILGHKPADWNGKVLREDIVAGRPVVVVEATPKTEGIKASSGYAKRELWIDKANFVALRTDYWDDSGTPLKTIATSDVQQVDGGKVQFMRLEASNQQTGHRTAMGFEGFKARTGLPDSLFTVAAIERGE